MHKINRAHYHYLARPLTSLSSSSVKAWQVRRPPTTHTLPSTLVVSSHTAQGVHGKGWEIVCYQGGHRPGLLGSAADQRVTHTLTLWVIMCPLSPLLYSESPPCCVCVNDKSTVFGGIKLASLRKRGVDNSGLCPVRRGGEGHGWFTGFPV